MSGFRFSPSISSRRETGWHRFRDNDSGLHRRFASCGLGQSDYGDGPLLVLPDMGADGGHIGGDGLSNWDAARHLAFPNTLPPGIQRPFGTGAPLRRTRPKPAGDIVA